MFALIPLQQMLLQASGNQWAVLPLPLPTVRLTQRLGDTRTRVTDHMIGPGSVFLNQQLLLSNQTIHRNPQRSEGTEFTKESPYQRLLGAGLRTR